MLIDGSSGFRDALRADCGRCFALCCVVPAFVASADFAIDKPAGHPCPHLQPDFLCSIHDQLPQRGFPGCTAYDCFGAGQHVAQVTFGGLDWHRTPEDAQTMFAAFTTMRHLHELLWYLGEALRLQAAGPLAVAVRHRLEEVEQLAGGRPQALVSLDVDELRARVNPLLSAVSEAVRAGVRPEPLDRRGADLFGKDLRKTRLVGANLRGALLIGANLAGADLELADLTGADLRGADVRGADLRESLFLTRPQVAAARGDTATGLPAWCERPARWGAPAQR